MHSAPKRKQERMFKAHLPQVLRRRLCALSHRLCAGQMDALLAWRTGTVWTAVRGAVQGTVSTHYIFRHLLWTHYFPGHFSFKFSLPRGDHALRGEAKNTPGSTWARRFHAGGHDEGSRAGGVTETACCLRLSACFGLLGRSGSGFGQAVGLFLEGGTARAEELRQGWMGNPKGTRRSCVWGTVGREGDGLWVERLGPWCGAWVPF